LLSSTDDAASEILKEFIGVDLILIFSSSVALLESFGFSQSQRIAFIPGLSSSANPTKSDILDRSSAIHLSFGFSLYTNKNVSNLFRESTISGLTTTPSLSCIHEQSADRMESFVFNGSAISALSSDVSLAIDHTQSFVFGDSAESPLAPGFSSSTDRI
jgi:hypothetical protein